MTQEDKARAYDEAYKKVAVRFGSNVADEIENIRKEIINYFQCQSRDEPSRKNIYNKWINYIENKALSKGDYDFLRDCARVLKTFGFHSCADRLIGLCPALGESIKEMMSIPIISEESEDERIRKDIIWCLKHSGLKDSNPINPHVTTTTKDAVAWLEKQGEKSTLPKWKYKKDNIPLLRDSIILNKYGCVAKSPSGALVDDVWVLDYDELAKLPKEEIEKQGEQKPILDVEIPFGAKDSELQEVSYNIPNGYHAEIEDNKVVIKKCEQKPIDFSDLRTWKYIVDAVLTEKEGIGQYLDSPFTEEVAKKLQKRFGNIEQKSAWSEEDERIYQSIIDDTVQENQLDDKQINWLKSLRPQSQWKPSDEQMNALQEAVIEMGKSVSRCSIEEFHEIESLYNDLKKLKE